MNDWTYSIIFFKIYKTLGIGYNFFNRNDSHGRKRQQTSTHLPNSLIACKRIVYASLIIRGRIATKHMYVQSKETPTLTNVFKLVDAIGVSKLFQKIP